MTNFDKKIKVLKVQAIQIVPTLSSTNVIPPDFQKEFFQLISQVNFSLLDDKDNFYGYFLFQMIREIRFDISNATAFQFKSGNYTIFFNPLLFLDLTMKQMETTIKHEILHILSLHFLRARQLSSQYDKVAINTAMDIAVNKYLNDLPPYSLTIERVNTLYGLQLKANQSFEYYVDHIQSAINTRKDIISKKPHQEPFSDSYDPTTTHDTWDEMDDINEPTLREFVKKMIVGAPGDNVPSHINHLIASLKGKKSELPWNLYLTHLLGTMEGEKKKTTTRRNRRQPDRMDLHGQLRSHKANITVAIDISGSMSDEEYRQAIQEILGIVKNYNHEITIVECDDQIRQTYKVRSIKDIKERSKTKGGTLFQPVFQYANKSKNNLLIYFTDGEGESRLTTYPKGYQVLWVLSGNSEKLSLKNPPGTIKKLSKVEKKDPLRDIGDIDRGGFSMNHHERD